MNRERCKELMPIFEAFSNGEEIDFRFVNPGIGESQGWMEALKLTLLDANTYEYRIKPKPREFWIDLNKPEYKGMDVIHTERPSLGSNFAGSTRIHVREVLE